MTSLTEQLKREYKAEREALAAEQAKVDTADAKQLAADNIEREVLTLCQRLEFLVPFEDEAKDIRKRLKQLGS